MLRGLVLISCTGADLGYGLAERSKPFLKTLLQVANVPAQRRNPRARRAATGDLPVQTEPNEQARPQHHAAPGHRRLRAVVLRDPALPLGHLRRPDAVPGEAVRDQGPLQRGDPAGRTVRRPHLRRQRRQSPEHRPGAERHAGAGDGRHRRQVRAAAGVDAGDPPHQDAARRDLHRTDARATATGPSSPTAAPCRRPTSPNRSSSTRSSAPSTRETRAAFRTWMQEAAVAINGQGQSLSYALGEFEPTFTDLDKLFRVLDTQRARGRRSCSATAPPPSRRCAAAKASWPSLIQSSNAVFQTTARRDRDIEALFRAFPTFQDESRLTLNRLKAFADQRRPADAPARAGGRRALADPDRLRQAGAGSEGLLRRPGAGDRPAPRPASRPCASSSATSSRRCCGPSIPFLRNLNPLLTGLNLYKHEVTSFFANIAAATNGELTDRKRRRRKTALPAGDGPAQPGIAGDLPQPPDDQPQQRLQPAAVGEGLASGPARLRHSPVQLRDHRHPRPGHAQQQPPSRNAPKKAMPKKPKTSSTA